MNNNLYKPNQIIYKNYRAVLRHNKNNNNLFNIIKKTNQEINNNKDHRKLIKQRISIQNRIKLKFKIKISNSNSINNK